MYYKIIVMPFMKPAGMALYPFIFIKHKSLLTDQILIRHEAIHLRQQLELLILPFYLLYLFNYLINLLICRNHHRAYMSIVFEKEAYQHEADATYLKTRTFYYWIHMI